MSQAHPQTDYPTLQARFGELWLKGRNRGAFIHQLLRNLRAALATAGVTPVDASAPHGRITLTLGDPRHCRTALAVLTDTPGLHSAQAMRATACALPELTAAAVALARAEWGPLPGRFAVDTRRPQKTAPLRSDAVNRAVGAALADATGWTVDLARPDRTLWIELRRHEATLWTVHRPAAGGLPVGSTGRALLLLSGGLDSPVAGSLAQRRGCALEAIYFHAPPFIPEATRDKVETLAARLAARQGGRLDLHVVPFTAIQQAIHQTCPARFTTLLYRRFMYRIADALAERRGLGALCTGESLGQVASQTLENLSAIETVSQRLTLRPLLTFDKHEITDHARALGTYTTSTLPHADCCTLFLPEHPATRANRHLLDTAEADLTAAALAATETVTLTPHGRPPAPCEAP